MEIQERRSPVLYLDTDEEEIEWNWTDEYLTLREIEQKAAELAYFLNVPLEIFWNELKFSHWRIGKELANFTFHTTTTEVSSFFDTRKKSNPTN